jgi:hypothetical protein
MMSWYQGMPAVACKTFWARFGTGAPGPARSTRPLVLRCRDPNPDRNLWREQNRSVTDRSYPPITPAIGD